jgi:predicted nucleic acid-binding Zn ribbon protein
MSYIFCDYKCKDCGHIYQVTKKTVAEDFPKKKCPECKSKNTSRVYNRLAYDVCEGMAGNQKTGYSKSVVYHPTAYGNLKRTKIK